MTGFGLTPETGSTAACHDSQLTEKITINIPYQAYLYCSD